MTTVPQQVDLVAHNSAIPIIIGVTGHRDLRPADVPQLKDQVKAILNDLRDNRTATPLLVLSPLAEGADRLVANVALEQGARLVVPLPLPREEYERDFETEESKNEFRELLKQAWKCFELPLASGNTSANIQGAGLERNRQYTQVGAYIARHSHILIALWDGEQTGLEGGTGQIVDFKLNGILEPFAHAPKPLDIVDNGPVYQIVTPRMKNPNPKGTAFDLEIKFPDGWKSSETSLDSLKESYSRILEQMDTFNNDARRLLNKLAGQIEGSRNDAIPEPERRSLSEDAGYILNQYSVADAMAQRYKKRRTSTLIALGAIALAAVLSFETYAHLLARPFVLALYPLALATALSVYLLARRKDFQNKHLDYRALAEGLRVQLFWKLAGLSDEVADHYLRQHRTELEWIRNAIRAWNVIAEPAWVGGVPAGESVARGSPEMLGYVLRHWVDGQRAFFDRNTTRDHGKLADREKLMRRLFGFGLVLAVFVVALHLWLPEFGESSRWRSVLIVIMGITPVIAAVIGGYVEKMAFSAQAKRYDWMKALFDRAASQLRKLLDDREYERAQAVILDLGIEALEENGDWVMIHRERTADVYKGA